MAVAESECAIMCWWGWTEVLVLWLKKRLGFWTAPSKHLENQLGIQTKSWFVLICILYYFVVPLSLYKSLMSFHSARRVELPKLPWWDERPSWTWQKTTVILPSSSNAFSTSIHDEILAEVLGVFLRKGEISMPFVTQICVVFVFSLYGLQKITCWISISGGFLCSFIFLFWTCFCLNSTHIDSASGLSQNNTPDITSLFFTVPGVSLKSRWQARLKDHCHFRLRSGGPWMYIVILVDIVYW